MTHDEARRIARDPSADPFDRYDAHKVLSKPEPLPKPQREHKLDTAPVAQDARSREAISRERQFQRDVLAEVIAELRAEASNDLERATRSLTAELADLKATLAELRLALASDRTKPLDLPALPSSRAVN